MYVGTNLLRHSILFKKINKIKTDKGETIYIYVSSSPDFKELYGNMEIKLGASCSMLLLNH